MLDANLMTPSEPVEAKHSPTDKGRKNTGVPCSVKRDCWTPLDK